MTYEQAFRLVTRAIAISLLFWVVIDLIELPREAYEVIFYWHLVHHYPDAPSGPHYLRLYLLYLAANVLKMALWLPLSGYFYRGGPSLQRFFAASLPFGDSSAQTR